MQRVAILATAAVALAVSVAGCAHTLSGAAVLNQREQPGGLRPGDADQVLLGAGEVGDVVGATLALDADRSRPIAGSSAVPACSALDAVGMSAFVGDYWSQFHVLLFTDGDRHEQVVSEAVAVYPDAAVAASAFAHGTRDAKSCDGQGAVGAGGDAAQTADRHPVDLCVPRRGEAAQQRRAPGDGLPRRRLRAGHRHQAGRPDVGQRVGTIRPLNRFDRGRAAVPLQ